MLRAAIFDFDGTLVDTMDFHYRAYRDVFAEMGWELGRELFDRSIGDKFNVTIPLLAQRALSGGEVSDIHARKRAKVEELFLTASIPVLSSALMLPLFAGRVPMALASSGSRPGIDVLLNRMKWRAYFSVVVTGEDVSLGKPDPEIFLLAAKDLDVAPDACLVFEDTDAGVSAALAAGMTVIDVRKPLSASYTGAVLWDG